MANKVVNPQACFGCGGDDELQTQLHINKMGRPNSKYFCKKCREKGKHETWRKEGAL